MAFDRLDSNPGLRFLVTLAAAFILVQGLRFAQPVLLPIALACFLAAICLPLVFLLARARLPQPLAILITLLVVAGVFALAILVGSQQLRALQAQVPTLVSAIFPHVGDWLARLEELAPMVDEGELRATVFGLLNAATLTALATGATTWALSLLSNTFLVFLILAFALAESRVLPDKLEAISVDSRDAPTQRYRKVVEEVQGYLVIKTLVSLCTGVVLGLWTWYMGLELPILLGLIAFALNYVPTIGSIIASAPAIALALVRVDPDTAALATVDFQHALIVGLGYVAVNVIFGNWLEPTLLGRRLGMSTLVVVLSLVFWGWLWGPVGAILSVPLTMVVKIMLENTTDLRWIAVLIDKKPPEKDGAASRGEGAGGNEEQRADARAAAGASA